MSVQQPDRSLMRKESLTFVVVTFVGAAALVLGLALIIFAQYHERAYIFLILGAGSLMGGIAGTIVVGQKIRAALDYGLIAMGSVGMVVGLNYLTSKYGPEPNLAHGYLVITLSITAILVGMIGEMVVRSKEGFVGFSSVIMLGVIGSIGLTGIIVGIIYLAVLNYPGNAYFLLAFGAMCLIGGIVWVIYVQHRVSNIHG